jgi:single-strand DNA-binding protein
MKAFGMATMGADMAVKYLPNGDPIGEASLAFRLGRKDKATGEYMTQWIKATLYGKRAESLAPYLTKGSKHAFVLRDIRIDPWTDKDGVTKCSLLADIDDVELGGQKQGAAPVQHPGEPSAEQMRNRETAKEVNKGSGFEGFPDDIPF